MSALVASALSTVFALVAIVVSSAARARAAATLHAVPAATATKRTNWYAPAFVTFGHIHGHRRPPS